METSYLNTANAFSLYIVVGLVLSFIVFTCILFMVKSYRAGLKLGMDKKTLRQAITSSASFTVLPSVSILLGVIALSGSLGIPISWLRLSVVGNLQYEATVASIAAESMGTRLDSSLLSMNHLVTILLVMTIGIIWSCVLAVFFLKFYARRLKGQKRASSDKEKKKGFADWAMVAMFIGLCATFIGSYVGDAVVNKSLLPILTAIFSGLAMWTVSLIVRKTGSSTLESFSLALSMLVGMAFAIVFNIIL